MTVENVVENVVKGVVIPLVGPEGGSVPLPPPPGMITWDTLTANWEDITTNWENLE